MTNFAVVLFLLAAFAPQAVVAQGHMVWNAVKEGLPKFEVNPFPIAGSRLPVLVGDPAKIGRGRSLLGVQNATGFPNRAERRLDEQIYVEVKVQQRVVATLPPGEDWKVGYGDRWVGWYSGGYWYGDSADNLLITVSACTEILETTRLQVPRAAWVYDPTVAGPQALTPTYLRSPLLKEGELEKRVAAIQKYLDASKIIGRGEMKKYLAEWLKGVRKSGVRVATIRCANAVSIGQPVTVSQHSSRRETQVLFVRGSWPDLALSWNH